LVWFGGLKMKECVVCKNSGLDEKNVRETISVVVLVRKT